MHSKALDRMWKYFSSFRTIITTTLCCMWHLQVILNILTNNWAHIWWFNRNFIDCYVFQSNVFFFTSLFHLLTLFNNFIFMDSHCCFILFFFHFLSKWTLLNERTLQHIYNTYLIIFIRVTITIWNIWNGNSTVIFVM